MQDLTPFHGGVPGWRRFETGAWAILVPPDVIPRVTTPAPDTTSMAVLRGWLAGDVPVSMAVTTRDRRGLTLRREARRLGALLHEPCGDGEAIEIAGAHGARRVEGTWTFEEALTEAGHERVVIVVAAARHAFVHLTVRTRRDDLPPAVREEVERVVGSLELHE